MNRARFECGKTQAQVAGQLEVSAETYGRWECGKSYSFLRQLGRIAEVLEVSEAELLGEARDEFLTRPDATTGDLLRTLIGEVSALRKDMQALALRLGKDVPR